MLLGCLHQWTDEIEYLNAIAKIKIRREIRYMGNGIVAELYTIPVTATTIAVVETTDKPRAVILGKGEAIIVLTIVDLSELEPR